MCNHLFQVEMGRKKTKFGSFSKKLKLMEEPERNVRIVSKILCHWQASKQFGRPKSRQNGLSLPATELSLNELLHFVMLMFYVSLKNKKKT